ncbi:MAG: mechanosensitive ion channel family protein [Planctomycetota bacterium]
MASHRATHPLIRVLPGLALVVSMLLPPAALGLIPVPPTGGASEGTPEAEAPPPPKSQLDDRYRSPRATVRTFIEARQALKVGRRSERAAAPADAAGALELPDGIEGAGQAAYLADQLNEVLIRFGDWVPADEAGGRRATFFSPLDGLPSRDAILAADERATADAAATADRPAVVSLYPSTDLRIRAMPGYLAIDRAVNESGRELFIELTRGPSDNWRFSERTLELIPEFRRVVADLPVEAQIGQAYSSASEWIRGTLVPDQLKAGTWLGIEYWQWLGVFVLLLVGFTFDMLVRISLRLLWGITTRNSAASADPASVKRAVRPFGLLTSAATFYFGLTYLLGLPAAVVLVPQIAVRVYLVFASVQAGWRLTDLVSEFLVRQAQRTKGRLDDLLLPLLRKTTKVFIVVGAGLYVAESLDLPVLPLLSGLGIGGLAFAFAAKDTIENFFGSIAVIADRPFEVGDWVQINDVEGTVETLGLRSTRIRTFYNSLVTVPNSELVRAVVDNYGRRKMRRYKSMLNVTYDTPPKKLEAFCEGIRELIRQHPYTHKDSYHVWVTGLGAHSIDILLYMFFITPDWATELRERHRLIIDIVRLADRLGVEFAFPTQTLHMYREEHGVPHEPSAIPTKNAEHDARAAGRDEAKSLVEDAHWRDASPGPVRFDGRPPPVKSNNAVSVPVPQQRRPKRSLFGRKPADS